MDNLWRSATTIKALGMVLLSTGAATASSAAAQDVLQPRFPGQVAGPMFFASVAVSAWYGGLAAGLLSSLLAGVCFEYYFVPPVHAINVSWADMPRLGMSGCLAILISVLNSRRHRAETAVRATEERMEAARAIQQRLFPRGDLNIAGFEIAGASHPAEFTGGDYFDYVPMSSGAIGIVVGDVSGHGFGSALLMAETRAYLRALARTKDDVGEILTLCNQMLAEDTDDERFCTLFFARMDLTSRRFQYAAAGHEAYLVGLNGEVQCLRATGLPLGIEKQAVIPSAEEINLLPGYLCLVATDGVLESRRRDEDAFGLQRLLDVVRVQRDKPAREVVDAVLRSVRDFSASCEDDRTIVIVKLRDTFPISGGNAT